MSAFRRGGFAVIGLFAGIFGLAFLSLVFRYAPLWGTRESLFVIVYLSFTYATLGGAVVGFLPRAATAAYVAGAGAAIAGVYGLGIVYYIVLGSGTIGTYLALVLVVGVVVQTIAARGFKFIGGRFSGASKDQE